MSETIAELSVRVARAEIERDAALERAKSAEAACSAFLTGDKEKLLDTLHVVGMPLRDVVDIYTIVQEWRVGGGKPNLLELYRELWQLHEAQNTESRPDDA